MVQGAAARGSPARSAAGGPGRASASAGRTLIATSRARRGVARAIDLAHAARAERSDDLVGADEGTGPKAAPAGAPVRCAQRSTSDAVDAAEGNERKVRNTRPIRISLALERARGCRLPRSSAKSSKSMRTDAPQAAKNQEVTEVFLMLGAQVGQHKIETEPLPPGHPFFMLDNVLLSPPTLENDVDPRRGY